MILLPVRSEIVDGETVERAENPPPGARLRRIPEGFACLEDGEAWPEGIVPPAPTP